MRKISLSKSLGSYNWCDAKEKSWQVILYIEDGPTISEFWDENDEPEIEGEPPSIVIELISKRLESYWVNTKREENRKKIEWVREHSAELDQDWALTEMKRLQVQSARIYKDIQNLQDYLEV